MTINARRRGRVRLAVSAGLTAAARDCGRGRFFCGYLKVVATCEACGLELGTPDTGDGPAVFVMFVVLVITVPLVFFVWAMFEPPVWVHAVLWPVVVIRPFPVAVAPAKGIMLALHYKHRPGEQ